MGDGITPLYILISLFPIILCFFCTPFALTTFLIGLINIDSCSIQPLIPIWILITSLILFIPTVTAFLCIIPCSARYLSRSDEKENQRIILRILLFTGLLVAIWSVPGYMSQSYIHQQYPELANTLPIAALPNPLHAGEQQWQHLLTNIRSSVSKKLTFIGSVYILIGLLNIGLELELLFDLSTSFFGGFVNGLLLFIVGIVTLTLCRQQVYVLTNQFVLVIIQLIVTIITFSFYFYFLYGIFDKLAHCFGSSSIYPCDRDGKIAFILIADLVHLFLTFCLIIVNLIIIRNARRPPTAPEISNYVVYTPRTNSVPLIYPNANAMNINSE